MINVPYEVMKLIENEELRKVLAIRFVDSDLPMITNKDIKSESLTFTESICSGEDFRFGGGELSIIEFEVYNYGNLNGEKINVTLRIMLGTEYQGDMTNIHTDSEGNYYCMIELGEFVVEDSKMQASTATFFSRTVTAYSIDKVKPVFAKQFDLLNKNGIKTMYLKSTELLDANDEYDLWDYSRIDTDIQSVYASYSRTIIDNGYAYEIRFRVAYDANYLKYARDRIVRTGKYDYVSEDKKHEILTTLYDLFDFFEERHTDSIKIIYDIVCDALDELNKNMGDSEYFFNIAYRGNDLRYRYFPTDRMPWRFMYIEIDDEYKQSLSEKTDFKPQTSKLATLTHILFSDKEMIDFLDKFYSADEKKQKAILSAMNMMLD